MHGYLQLVYGQEHTNRHLHKSFSPKEPKPIYSIRRSLQGEYLNILLEIMLGTTDIPEDGCTLA
ncbi:hypothetical protein [Nostoc sp.]|uniref:hypothetical protein n=1 Tax=Nostoc sp. TaxID=1180 RepID=UPI003FA5D490